MLVTFLKMTMILTMMLVLLLFAVGAASGLKCHCNACSKDNHTCITDGICFATTTMLKNGIISHDYRCIPQEQLYPPDNPIFCHHSHSLDDRFAIACCRGPDYCNANITPTLAPPRVQIGKVLMLWVEPGGGVGGVR